MEASRGALGADWLAICRRCGQGVRAMLERHPTTAARGLETGRGEGGDIALVIDRAAEDVVFAELEASGLPLTAVSEERGRVELGGGGPVHVVIDPIDGSMNAKRLLPFHALSIAVAGGPVMGDVTFGYVVELAGGSEWWARSGEGAFLDGERLGPPGPGAQLELIGIETARPGLVARAAHALERSGARRMRTLGSVALSLCLVAAGRLDAMVTLREVRSVDVAAAQLLVREAGGALAFPDCAGDPSLGLDLRTRVAAATGPGALEQALGLLETRA